MVCSDAVRRYLQFSGRYGLTGTLCEPLSHVFVNCPDCLGNRLDKNGPKVYAYVIWLGIAWQ
jgi:hypothetical protein